MYKEKLPECLLIGAAKSATTSLAHYLSQSPEVTLARGKEAHFFDSDERFERGLDYYQDQFFRAADESTIWIDATPNYMHVPWTTIGRIKETYQQRSPKFLVVVRDPVKRSLSHYLHRLRNGQEPLSFEDAIKSEPARVDRDPREWWRYFSDSLYGKQLSDWFAAFGSERFLIIKQSDLLNDPVGQTNKALKFIGCSLALETLDAEHQNTATAARFGWLNKILNMRWPIPLFIKRRILKETGPRIRQKLRQLNQTEKKLDKSFHAPNEAFLRDLRARFLEDIELLERITGQTFNEWK